VRRADLAALLVAVAAVGYTIFALAHASLTSHPAAVHRSFGSSAAGGEAKAATTPSGGTPETTGASPTAIPSPSTPVTVPGSAGAAPAGRAKAASGAGSSAITSTEPGGPNTKPATASVQPAAPVNQLTTRSSSASQPSPGNQTGSGNQPPPGNQPGSGNQPGPPVVSPNGWRPAQTAASTNPTAPRTTNPTAAASTVNAPGAWVPCSQPSQQTALVTFHNPSPTGRRLAWVSPTCQLSAAVMVPAGGSVTLPTVVGNCWAFVDPASGRPVGSTVIYPGQRDAWVY
jgi:hypothetical protein